MEPSLLYDIIAMNLHYSLQRPVICIQIPSAKEIWDDTMQILDEIMTAEEKVGFLAETSESSSPNSPAM